MAASKKIGMTRLSLPIYGHSISCWPRGPRTAAYRAAGFDMAPPRFILRRSVTAGHPPHADSVLGTRKREGHSCQSRAALLRA